MLTDYDPYNPIATAVREHSIEWMPEYDAHGNSSKEPVKQVVLQLGDGLWGFNETELEFLLNAIRQED